MQALEVRRLLAASWAYAALEQANSSFPAPSRICTSLSISSSCHKHRTYMDVFSLLLRPTDKRIRGGTVCRSGFSECEKKNIRCRQSLGCNSGTHLATKTMTLLYCIIGQASQLSDKLFSRLTTCNKQQLFSVRIYNLCQGSDVIVGFCPLANKC